MIKLFASTREFLSHPIEQEKHLLIDHLKTVAERSEHIFSKAKFKNIKIAFYAGLLHDIGKLNPFYQRLFNERKNRHVLEKQIAEKYERVHSPLSAWAADKLLSKNLGLDNNTISKILILIYGHHSKIRKMLGKIPQSQTFINSRNDMVPNLEEFARQTSKIPEFEKLDWNNCIVKFKRPVNFDVELKNSKNDAVDDFLEMEFAFSCLLQADRGSFSEFEELKFDLKINTANLKTKTTLAEIRTEFQNQVMENFDVNKAITVINAPTGIGKTKVFLDLISKFSQEKDIERIFYFSPLLALTDDFEKKLSDSIPDQKDKDQVLSYNNIFAGSIEEKKLFESGQRVHTKWSFPIESFNKKFVVTTTQRLLMTLYSNKQRENLKLASFRNSILIIDEVQIIPKFILANLKKILLKLNQYMGARIILVSATIPYEISDLNKVRIDDNIIEKYLDIIQKSITVEQLDLQKIPAYRTLIMSNTRKKAANIFSLISKIHDDKALFYMSTGIRKKDRKEILKNIMNHNEFVLVSTQVVEAGVDVSFSNVYREIAPLDNIIQVMGRLNREGLEPQARLVVFESDKSHVPYSELEFNESLEQIKEISDSKSLYSVLPKYYEIISIKNRVNANRLAELEEHMQKLDFEQVWAFINRYVFLDDDRDTMFVPDLEEWDEVKDALMNDLPKETYKKYGLLTASLPHAVQLSESEYFDAELLEKNILLPKKEKLDEVYDKKLGLDKWLMTS